MTKFKTFNLQRKITLNKILDFIQQSNGVSIRDISEKLEMSWLNTKNACDILMKENCISEGSIDKFNKSGIKLEKFDRGFFYESDLPETLNLKPLVY